MPSLRQISTSRSAHETNAPRAHTVINCQNPPSASGAKVRPYLTSGGLMLICQMFHVGPSDAAYKISATPTKVKKIVVTPKKPTKNGPTQKTKRTPPNNVPPRTRYYRSKLSMAISHSSGAGN